MKARQGFTLIEVLMAAFILTLVSVFAMITTHRLCGFAKYEVERMVAASYCSDVYMRLLRMDGAVATNEFVKAIWNGKPQRWSFRMPPETLARINGECILMRNGYEEPKCVIQTLGTSTGSASSSDSAVAEPNVIISVLWGSEDNHKEFAVTNLLSYGINNNGWTDGKATGGTGE